MLAHQLDQMGQWPSWLSNQSTHSATVFLTHDSTARGRSSEGLISAISLVLKSNLNNAARNMDGLPCVEHLKTYMSNVLAISNCGRGRELDHMFVPEGELLSNGLHVCHMFLREVFQFSPDLQSSLKQNREALAGFLNRSQSHWTPLTVQCNRRAPQCDAIISFLKRRSQWTSDPQPDCEEIHLPFYRKSQFYSLFFI